MCLSVGWLVVTKSEQPFVVLEYVSDSNTCILPYTAFLKASYVTLHYEQHKGKE